MDEAIVAKKTLPALEGGMENGLLVVLEVWDLQGQVPDRPSEYASPPLSDGRSLCLIPWSENQRTRPATSSRPIPVTKTPAS